MWLINTMCPSDTLWWNITGSTLAQVMDCCLTAPSHYLNQCWLLIGEILWHSPQSNFTANAQATILYTVMSLKFTLLKSLPHLPGSSELIFIHGWMNNYQTILWLSLILMWLHIHAKLKWISNSNVDPDNKVFSGSHRSNTGISSTQYEQIPIIRGAWPFWLTPFFSVNNILAGVWLNCISSVEITLFLLADILLQHMALFQC